MLIPPAVHWLLGVFSGIALHLGLNEPEQLVFQQSQYLSSRGFLTIGSRDGERTLKMTRCGLNKEVHTLLSRGEGNPGYAQTRIVAACVGNRDSYSVCTFSQRSDFVLGGGALNLQRTAALRIQPCWIPNFGRPLFKFNNIGFLQAVGWKELVITRLPDQRIPGNGKRNPRPRN